MSLFKSNAAGGGKVFYLTIEGLVEGELVEGELVAAAFPRNIIFIIIKRFSLKLLDSPICGKLLYDYRMLWHFSQWDKHAAT